MMFDLELELRLELELELKLELSRDVVGVLMEEEEVAALALSGITRDRTPPERRKMAPRMIMLMLQSL